MNLVLKGTIELLIRKIDMGTSQYGSKNGFWDRLIYCQIDLMKYGCFIQGSFEKKIVSEYFTHKYRKLELPVSPLFGYGRGWSKKIVNTGLGFTFLCQNCLLKPTKQKCLFSPPTNYLLFTFPSKDSFFLRVISLLSD